MDDELLQSLIVDDVLAMEEMRDNPMKTEKFLEELQDELLLFLPPELKDNRHVETKGQNVTIPEFDDWLNVDDYVIFPNNSDALAERMS